jgi:alkanesulfonate monooxygenase SsuD/methylene tetrahydromethanopterin reductase-like flavin-dependent oxidoreductase (luciferase family)
MRFSLYSEIQYWNNKSYKQAYDEVLEQIVSGDRLGYDCYSIIEHFFFENFSISSNPFALFGAASGRTNNINFRSMGHVMPYHNPVILASQIAAADIIFGERYEYMPIRGHAWMAWKAGIDINDTRPLYEEALDILAKAFNDVDFSHSSAHYEIRDTHVVPRPQRKPRCVVGGTSDRTYEIAAEQGWAVAVPPLLPYPALKDQLDFYRAKCAEHGNTPDIIWIHACHLDQDRETALVEAEESMLNFIKGNASPEPELPPPDVLEEANYGFYAAGILGQMTQIPYKQLVDDDYVWVGTPADIVERIKATQEICEGITEFAITVNAGGIDHWKSIKTQELFAHEVMPHIS